MEIFRQSDGFLRFLLAAFLAIDESQLVRDARVARIELRRLLQPLLRVRQIALLEVRESQVICRVGKGRLRGSLAQVLDGVGKITVFNVEASEVVKNVGMISGFAANGFQLAAGFSGFVLLEHRNRQRKLRAQNE